MRKVAIFGAAGAIGRTIGGELERRGIPFRAVGRTKPRLVEAFGKLQQAEIVAAESIP
jgi:short-subunit dehydrogenase